jgi:hypothetical protein
MYTIKIYIHTDGEKLRGQYIQIENNCILIVEIIHTNYR